MKCTRCNRRIRFQLWETARAILLAGHTYLTERLRLVVGLPGSEQAMYCRRCTPDVRFCRECGGTHEAPSTRGSVWSDFDPGICTACEDLDAFLAAKEAA